jgi:arylsulfatase
MKKTITRRKFLSLMSQQAAGLMGFNYLTGCSCHKGQEQGKKPNIVLIMADDLGFSDLGCYGGEINTPNIDRLANNGVRFTQFYNNAVCTPTRESLLTGLYPQQVSKAPREKRIPNCVSLADVLKSAGYHTLMTGKWHNGSSPVKMGFDRYYGIVSGACNYFNPGRRRKGENEPGRKYPDEMRPWMRDGELLRPYTPENSDFYATEAFTDQAIAYLDQYGNGEKPFFLHISYTAPHFPLHALPEDIDRYRGKYLSGWDKIRQQRYERLVALGLINRNWKFPDRDSIVPAWEDVEKKDEHDLTMAVYAAMIDRMDQGIGRIIQKIEQLGVEDNTLVLFLSDNGSCSSIVNATPNILPGPMESYRTLDPPWANASNSPFRKYKTWVHEGGISTPLIAYWPKAIPRSRPKITNQVGHVMDIMATVLEIAGAQYPTEYDNQPILPLTGKSLLPVFLGKQRQGHDALFWNINYSTRLEYIGYPSFAARMGKWKIVASQEKQWELYDIEADRTETENLASNNREVVNRLKLNYEHWLAKLKELSS